MPVYCQPTASAKNTQAKILMKGAAKRTGKIERPRSTVKRSALIRLINLPELVSVMLFIESFVALSNRLATSVLLIFKETSVP